jgi:hypothetical protein
LHFSQLRPLVINLRSNIPSPKPIYILKVYSPVVAHLVAVCSFALKPKKYSLHVSNDKRSRKFVAFKKSKFVAFKLRYEVQPCMHQIISVSASCAAEHVFRTQTNGHISWVKIC